MCGGSGHNPHKCPQKKAEGVGERFDNSVKYDAVQDTVRLEDEGNLTAQHSMLMMGSQISSQICTEYVCRILSK